MQSTEREDFNRELATLCAAFGVPVADRAEAFWKGFSRLSLGEFSRIVARAVGEDGPGKMPTVAQLWGIRRQMRAGGGQQQRGSVADQRARLVEQVAAIRRLSDRQRATVWSWIVRWFPDPSTHDPTRQGCVFLGVVVPQDPVDPDRWPAQRVMLDDLGQLGEAA